LGYVNPGRWERIMETYAQLGMLPKVPPVDEFIFARDPVPNVRGLVSVVLVLLVITAMVIGVAVRFYRLSRTVRKQAIKLQAALDDVKTLRGIIPICSYCHKVRDDDGAWGGLEKYVREHSDAAFSHGICHDCYPKVQEEIEQEKLAARKRRAAQLGEGTAPPYPRQTAGGG